MSSSYSRALISVIIPTHGRDHFLINSLDSVINQTIKPLEVLIVDDIGQQSTKGIIKKAQKNTNLMITYLFNNLGKGPSLSRNIGAKKAKGKYLAFLDDDDVWQSTFLQEMYDLALKLKHDMVLTGIEHFNRGLNCIISSKTKRCKEGLGIENVIINNVGITGSNMLINKHVFLNLGGYDITLKISEDRDLFVRFLAKGYNYGVTSTNLLLLRLHSESRLSSNRTSYYFRDKIKIILRHIGKAKGKAKYFVMKRLFKLFILYLYVLFYESVGKFTK